MCNGETGGFTVCLGVVSKFLQTAFRETQPKLARPVLHSGTESVDQIKVETIAVVNVVNEGMVNLTPSVSPAG